MEQGLLSDETGRVPTCRWQGHNECHFHEFFGITPGDVRIERCDLAPANLFEPPPGLFPGLDVGALLLERHRAILLR